MNIQQSIIDEINSIKLSDLSQDEKSAKIIKLARELERILLEGDKINPSFPAPIEHPN